MTTVIGAVLNILAVLSATAMQGPQSLSCADDGSFPSDDVHVCRLPLVDTEPAQLRDTLGERDLTATLDGEVLSVAVAKDAETYRLCCTIQEPLTRVEDGLFAGRWRLRRADEAVLYFALLGTGPDGALALRDKTWIVGDARPSLPQTDSLAGRIEDLSVPSEALGELRAVKLYLPPGTHDEPLPVIVFADGGGLERRAQLFEPMVAAGEVGPFVAVGIVSGPDAVLDREGDFSYDVRAADYLPGFGEDDPERGAGRFSKHLIFVADELYPYLREAVSQNIAPSGWIAAGQSNGAVFAQHAAMERPDRFGGAIVASRAWGRMANVVYPPQGARPWFTMTAGLYEPTNLASTETAAEALRQAGYDDVSVALYPGGHDYEQWDVAIYKALIERFGRRD